MSLFAFLTSAEAQAGRTMRFSGADLVSFHIHEDAVRSCIETLATKDLNLRYVLLNGGGPLVP